MACGMLTVFLPAFSLTLTFQAPGEAEATLSMMTTSGIPVRVDAILTDDSDSFVFGARTVLRMYVTWCTLNLIY
jgi:5'-3' exonuclease